MKKVIIIGAGILGATTAYQLARKKIDVTIIDYYNDGQATDAAAGIVCPWLSQRRNKAWYHLAKGGARIYPTLINLLKEDGEYETGYAKTGAISLHKDPKKLQGMIERATKRKVDAPEIGDITLLNELETNQIFPLLDPEFRAIHVSGAARVNGKALKTALLNGAQKHGATIINGQATLLHQHRKIIGAKVNHTEILADTVIATNGVWMGDLLKPLAINLHITSQKAQIIHLHIPELKTDDLPVIMPPNDQYFVPFPNGQLVAGATHENNVGLDYRVTVSGVNEILTKALTIAPGIENSQITETRIGFRPFTPGFLPVIGPVPQFSGLLVANGLGASGLTMGPYIGTELAKLALGEDLDIDINNYPVTGAMMA